MTSVLRRPLYYAVNPYIMSSQLQKLTSLHTVSNVDPKYLRYAVVAVGQNGHRYYYPSDLGLSYGYSQGGVPPWIPPTIAIPGVVTSSYTVNRAVCLQVLEPSFSSSPLLVRALF